jgi:hypothetical protein
MEALLALSAVVVVMILGRRYLKSHQAPATNEEAAEAMQWAKSHEPAKQE